jgi:hypothetical protein
MPDQNYPLLLFISISKHRMISHYLPKLKISLESLSNDQIWLKESEDLNSVGGIMLHVIEHIKWNTERLKNREVNFNKGIEDFFPESMVKKPHLNAELDIVFEELENALSIAKPEQIDMHSIYHLVEHTGYHLGQIIARAQKMSGKNFYFVQNGINERELKKKIEEESN